MSKKALLAYSMLLASPISTHANCWFFEEVDKGFQHMEKRMTNMRNMFSEMEKQLYANDPSQINNTKGKIAINQKEDNVLIDLNLGKGITNFDAKIKTKKSGYKKDQIVISTEEPQKQTIVITVVDNYLSINQTTQTKQVKKEKADTCTCKTCKKCKKPITKKYAESFTQSSSTIARTFDKKLDIEKTEIEYDAKEGILSIIIPKEKIDKLQGKTINIKIKTEKQVDGK